MSHLDPLTFPIFGRRLIEASAGTGKTYTIGALYVRLVLGHGGKNAFFKPLMPPEILVVTFTNAATEELRHRIRKKLVEAAAYFAGARDGDDFLEGLGLAFSPESWPEKAKILEEAALWMDEAAIFTIHSWSSRMLRQHAFLCGTLFDLELAPDDRDLLEEASCDYWRAHLYHLPPAQLADLLDLIQCATPEALITRIRPLLGRNLCSEGNPFELLEQRHRAISTAFRAWRPDFQNAVDLIKEARKKKILNGTKFSNAFLPAAEKALCRWIHEKGPLPDPRVLHRFSRAGLKDGTNKGKTPPEHPAYDAFDRLNGVLAQLDIEKALLVHAAGEIHTRYERQKSLQRLVGFDDLLDRLDQALRRDGSGKLAERIADQYPVAMIDEFQDTDPVQYAVFSKIYGNRPRTALLMIGDPKQAIYAFRGADIHTYLKARKDTLKEPHTLDANYRATEELVHSTNQLFQFAEKYPAGAFLFGDLIPFDPVSAKGPRGQLIINSNRSSGIHLRQMAQNDPVPKTGPRGYLAKMASAFAHEIVQILNLSDKSPPVAGFRDTPKAPLRPVRPSDMAVLVRSGGEAEIIREALEKRGVKSVYLSDRASVFDSPEALEILYMLRACASPKEERKIKAALAVPMAGLSPAHLDRLNRNETAWEAEADRFGRYHNIWMKRGVLPMLRTFLQDFGMISGILSTPGGERAVTNFLHLAELLQVKSLETQGPVGLINWLEEQLSEHSSGSEEQVLRLESDEALIRVVTIHKSKGLQYPLVFLPFICSHRRTTGRDVFMTADPDEQEGVRLVGTPEAADIEAADRTRLAEDLRLLYVAVTRAQYACWMGIGATGTRTKSGEKSRLHQSGFGYLLGGGEMIPTEQLSVRLHQLKGNCPHITVETVPEPVPKNSYEPRVDDVFLLPARPFDTPLSRDWRITSYSGILKAPGVHAFDNQEVADREIPFDFPFSAVEDQLREPEESMLPHLEPEYQIPSIHNFPRGPEPGTFLHGLLEWAAAEGFEKVAREPSRIRVEVASRARHRPWQFWVDAVSTWLKDFLKTPFPLPGREQPVRLADLSPSDCRPELEFLFAANRVNLEGLDENLTREILPGAERPPVQIHHINGMLKGFVDLVFIWNGKYYVLDYKSNYLGANAPAYHREAMARAMLRHRYDLQYVLYILALHRLLKARLPDYRFERDMGGAVYLFLRGVDGNRNGVHGDKPPERLIEHLDLMFKGEKASH